MLNWLPLSLKKPASLTNLTNSLLAKLGTPPLGTPKAALPRQETGCEWDTASDRMVNHPAPWCCYSRQVAALNKRRLGRRVRCAAAFAAPTGVAAEAGFTLASGNDQRLITIRPAAVHTRRCRRPSAHSWPRLKLARQPHPRSRSLLETTPKLRVGPSCYHPNPYLAVPPLAWGISSAGDAPNLHRG